MIIGLTGKLGSGKDTVVELMQHLEPYANWQNKKLSVKVKQIAYILTGYADQYSQVGKSHFLQDWGMTVREFQQKLGTEVIRNGLHENALLLALLADYTPSQNWIISDIRFPNEVRELHSRGFEVYRVIRHANPLPLSSHMSELALDDEPLPEIYNNGSVEQLMQEAQRVLDECRKSRASH
jgi:hypothetical protein